MAVEISGVTQCPSDDLITGAYLDYPQTGPVDGHALQVSGWVVSKAPVVEVEFVHEGSAVARCGLDVSRPDVAKAYGSSSQVGFCKAIGTVGLAPDFTIEVRVVFQDGRRDVIAEIRGTQQLTLTFTPCDDDQQHSVVGSDPIDISTYLFPNELQVTKVPLKKMLLIGSCLSNLYVERFRKIDPELEIHHIFQNNVRQLPALTAAQLDTHQLQYIQLPLREVLTDRIVRICDIDRAAGFGEILDDARAKLAAMLDAAMAYNKQHGLLTLVANFFVPQGHAAPSLAGLGGEGDLTAVIAEVNRTLALLVPKYQNAYVADVNSLANSYGKRNFLDDIIYFYSHGSVLAAGAYWAQLDNWPSWSAPRRARVELVPDLDELYQLQPEPFFKLALDQIRYVHRVAQQVDQVKIVIFDLDNTLWRGQIAEHYETGREWPNLWNWPGGMWETVHHLRRRGILVSLCSKNDESLVRDRWSRAVEMPWISLDDFIAPKINWNRKSENVRAILSELNLTSKSALFVDDSPVERSEVLSGVPGIRAIGGNPFVTRRILLWSAETQRSVLTDESMNRETSYRGILARNAEMESMDRESFLQSLQIRIQLHHITEIDSPLLPRVLELANKTTQFNTTGLKWTPPELTTFIEKQGAIFAFSVQDKFADYGLVGAVFVSESVVRQFVMSCRVLGNNVELNALKQILKLVRDQDEGPSILGTVIPNEVNGPCHDIYLRSGFQETETPDIFVILKATL
jgi:FkbH-like protein